MAQQKLSDENRSSSPLFIVFEGPHGSGKSYYSKGLVKILKRNGLSATYTKEPYSIHLRKLIRTISTAESNNPFALFHLINADRTLHLKDVKNLLAQGTIVVSDRYFYSTAVYQRIQGIPIRLIDLVNRTMPLPDVVFYVDTPMDVRKARIVRRGHKPRDLFYDDKSMKLEDKFYRDIKSKMRRKKDAVIVNGESKRELENIVNIVLKRINRNSRQ